MTGLICSICANLIRFSLLRDSQASINNVTARAESDLKPISHLASKRVIAGKSSVPRSHILSTNNSVCVEQTNNSFFFAPPVIVLIPFAAVRVCNTLYHFFTVAVAAALWNEPVLSFVHVS